ncbi:ArsR family transcriptional regulator [Halorussus salinisoli]|uniref:ArsR family transcriptional regulator n=1 Tax=Halorussus salinisoli TaxID=2558242 RepID=UPI0010C23C7E|nr:ArsR family transcriptional regulator [Halorussus salinisoli]
MGNRSEGELCDDRLEALGRYERRRLLLGLSTANPHEDSRIDFGELDRNSGELDPLVVMRHLHLPYLEERGFIRWDRDNQVVSKGSRFDEMEPLLQLLREIEDELPGRWT